MAKGARKKQRDAQQKRDAAMDADDGGGGWATAPIQAAEAGAADYLEMDTGEAGAPQQQRQPGEKVDRKRGKASTKQKQRKRKSLEKALAVASRKETKVAKKGQAQETKKGLKKLWQKDASDK